MLHELDASRATGERSRNHGPGQERHRRAPTGALVPPQNQEPDEASNTLRITSITPPSVGIAVANVIVPPPVPACAITSTLFHESYGPADRRPAAPVSGHCTGLRPQPRQQQQAIDTRIE